MEMKKIRKHVNSKFVDKTTTKTHSELYYEMFGKIVSEHEARKRLYGIRELFGMIDEEQKSETQLETRILTISDLHIPFQLPVETFEKYVNNVDVLVINGDILDCQSLSKFPKMYRISFMEEMIEGRKYLIDLIRYINPALVKIVVGNHDARMGQYLARNLDGDILELMPNNPLELIVEDGFRHNDKRTGEKTWYEPIRNVLDVDIEYDGKWWTKVGKTIFCHPLAYSSGTLKTTEKAVQYFNSIREEFECVVMAHTHKLACAMSGGIYMFEQGTCSQIEKLNYMDGRLAVPQQKGYLYIVQDKLGNLIYDKTKLEKL